jgi:hypothetical protein
MNPYIMPMQQAQDVSGLLPIYQAIGQQQAMQNAALAQQNQLMNQAGQTTGGFNPSAMAQMLRGGNMSGVLSSIPANLRYGSSNVYGGLGQGKVPTAILADTWGMGE